MLPGQLPVQIALQGGTLRARAAKSVLYARRAHIKGSQPQVHVRLVRQELVPRRALLLVLSVQRGSTPLRPLRLVSTARPGNTAAQMGPRSAISAPLVNPRRSNPPSVQIARWVDIHLKKEKKHVSLVMVAQSHRLLGLSNASSARLVHTPISTTRNAKHVCQGSTVQRTGLQHV